MTFPKAGTVNEKPLETRILSPGEIFTDKFFCTYCDTEIEALNAQKYFATRFYRAGLDSKTTSWILYRKWHSNVPIQDFTPHTSLGGTSDIDWSKSIPEIDQQLCKNTSSPQKRLNLLKLGLR
jgi:hypothetical protein